MRPASACAGWWDDLRELSLAEAGQLDLQVRSIRDSDPP
jgi:hypothetical protein